MYDIRRPQPLPLDRDRSIAGRISASPPLPPPPMEVLPGRIRLARPGEVLHRQATPSDRVFAVLAGGIALSAGALGHRAVVGFLGPGDAFGLEAVLPDIEGVALPEARAITSVRLLVMPGPEARQAYDRHLVVAGWVAAALAARLAWAECSAIVLAEPAAPDRVLALLGVLALRWGRRCSRGTAIQLPITQDLIATAVGLTRETVNRALRQLRLAGAVSRSGRTYVLEDRATWLP